MISDVSSVNKNNPSLEVADRVFVSLSSQELFPGEAFDASAVLAQGWGVLEGGGVLLPLASLQAPMASNFWASLLVLRLLTESHHQRRSCRYD